MNIKHTDTHSFWVTTIGYPERQLTAAHKIKCNWFLKQQIKYIKSYQNL